MTYEEGRSQFAQAALDVERMDCKFREACGNLIDDSPRNYRDRLHRFEQAKKDQKKANERFHRLADARAGWPRYPGLRTLTV